ncbi:hypothetical protein GCM10010293_61470 [Streptomyces griseoflavus]|nr:hypothetical protein GCM10010293_61470 [Streptomyces griseoflavus]
MKGRQFPAIALALPSRNNRRSSSGPTALDHWEDNTKGEPRRVLYVGTSRAQGLLLLLIPKAQTQRVLRLLTRDAVPFHAVRPSSRGPPIRTATQAWSIIVSDTPASVSRDAGLPQDAALTQAQPGGKTQPFLPALYGMTPLGAVLIFRTMGRYRVADPADEIGDKPQAKGTTAN